MCTVWLEVYSVSYTWIHLWFASVDLTKFLHLFKCTRYCLMVLVLHDSMMMPQAPAEMFCCLSLVLTRDMPAVEVWATEGAVWSCRMLTGEGRPPSIDLLAGCLTFDTSLESKLAFSTVGLRLWPDLPAFFEELWTACWKEGSYKHIYLFSSNTLHQLHRHRGLHAMIQKS